MPSSNMEKFISRCLGLFLGSPALRADLFLAIKRRSWDAYRGWFAWVHLNPTPRNIGIFSDKNSHFFIILASPLDLMPDAGLQGARCFPFPRPSEGGDQAPCGL
ncbi:hypothetical protein BDV59DRAFT_175889 [Aspergillus ambiguus]|uniref:uncharacterized protein n=1 Tax=Aspergillus ambiguus TaxID=176160 RepID=UPI003CCCF33F